MSDIRLKTWAVLFTLVLQGLLLSGCTIRIDNPFYSPASLDVNKVQSAAVNNYGKK